MYENRLFVAIVRNDYLLGGSHEFIMLVKLNI